MYGANGDIVVGSIFYTDSQHKDKCSNKHVARTLKVDLLFNKVTHTNS